MQQNIIDCRKMVKAIRDSIRKEAALLGLDQKAGFIKISLVPSTKDADETLGGYSDVKTNDSNDYVSYEYTYMLNEDGDFKQCETSGFATVVVKHRELLSTNNEAGSVYVWKDYFDATVRVSGANDHNKELARKAYDAILPFFAERLPDFSVTLN